MPSDAMNTPISREDVLAATVSMLDVKPAQAGALARERGWLDESDEPTAEGRKVVGALREQKNTRSVFR